MKAGRTVPAAGAEGERRSRAGSRRIWEAEAQRLGGDGKIPELQPGVALLFAYRSRGGGLDPAQDHGKAPHDCARKTNPPPGLERRAPVQL